MTAKANPMAGKRAEPSMLVNVTKLITAYYAEKPDRLSLRSGSRSGHRDIAVRRSKNPSTKRIFSPLHKPYVCTASNTRSTARYLSA